MKLASSDIASQIAKLEKQRDALLSKERTKAIARVLPTIREFGLTASELGISGNGAKKSAPAAKGKPGRKPKTGQARTGKALAVKYKDDQGNTWVGRGKRPQWFKDALDAGKTAEQLAA